ncbi:hypothetical protein SEA_TRIBLETROUBLE_35 [Mycobacterium Phage TribleTrouble]|nr:hypothetical protein SEA_TRIBLETROUBLE_35 [Mycobacterium Phage TribleTrouble]
MMLRQRKCRYGCCGGDWNRGRQRAADNRRAEAEIAAELGKESTPSNGRERCDCGVQH